MEKKVYTGLEAEYVSFGDSDIGTLPDGYSGCFLGTVELYVSPDDHTEIYNVATCWSDIEDDFIYNWVEWKNRKH